MEELLEEIVKLYFEGYSLDKIFGAMNKMGDVVIIEEKPKEKLKKNYKICPRCNKELPLNKEHFYKHKKNNNSFHTYCISCHNDLAKEKRMLSNPEIFNQFKLDYKLGQAYKIKVKNHKGYEDEFKGRAEHETERLIWFKHIKFGYLTSFHKTDFKSGIRLLEEM